MKFYLYFFSLILLCLLTISATVLSRAGHPAASADGLNKGTEFDAMYAGTPVSSPFGLRIHPVHAKRFMHLGIDFALPAGTPVRAAEGGVVFEVVNKPERSIYGRHLSIRHADGYTSRYAHLSRVTVQAGQKVGRGEVLGHSGSASEGARPHLHFEVRRNGEPIDPMQFLQRQRN